MRIISLLVTLLLTCVAAKEPTMPIYQFEAETIEGKTIALKEYEGRVLLIVNTASKCGFTPQYEGLEKLYKKYKDEGLTILGFPCNQFASQEPLGNDEIANFCRLSYGVTFPMFAKIDVNGADAHPLYQFLKHEATGTLGSESIKWNFTKFLVDRNGKVIERYAPATKPESLTEAIEALLAHKAAK